MARRTDLARDPAVITSLQEARLAQAYFSRKLNELGNEELYLPSLRPGWTCAHVVAHVGYHARGVTRLTEWAETGIRTDMYESDAARIAEIELGATQSARALRHLSDHAAVALDVAWRDLPDEKWRAQVEDDRGQALPISAMIDRRTLVLWQGALDLGNGARTQDVPAAVRSQLTSYAA